MALLEKNMEEEQELTALAAELEQLEKKGETIDIFGFNEETHFESEIATKEESTDIQSSVAVTRVEFEAFKSEIYDIMEGIDNRIGNIETRVNQMADFYNKTAEVVNSMVEQAAFEAIGVQLENNWAPRFEQILNEVEKIKAISTTDKNVMAEIKLNLPLLRRFSTLEPLIIRAEKAASVVDAHVRRFTDKKEPTSATGPGLLG